MTKSLQGAFRQNFHSWSEPTATPVHDWAEEPHPLVNSGSAQQWNVYFWNSLERSPLTHSMYAHAPLLASKNPHHRPPAFEAVCSHTSSVPELILHQGSLEQHSPTLPLSCLILQNPARKEPWAWCAAQKEHHSQALSLYSLRMISSHLKISKLY